MTGQHTAGATRLAGERSPFLQHGATQPVQWWPWGAAAFREARESDRPVLLDVGAVWCHWCHVMDSESYESDETAALINDLFVPVKVDRDELPDVDARYQRAVQILTGQGGWPLTAFLTPDGEVFYGGTYFPPRDAHGRPSFTRVLREVSRIWREERPRAADAARTIRERVDAYATTETEAGEPAVALVDEAVEELAGSFDFRYGGFGRAPKFPNAGALDLLLDRWLDTGTDWARRVVTDTLLAMGRGGMFDQLAGGFHRYSTDARWIIPHFEKMAYDNGPLLATYSAAASAFGDPFLADVAGGIIAHYRDVAPDLLEQGGFPASQDADSGFDNDGDYWTWTDAELRDALGDGDRYTAARLAFGLDDPAGSMHIDRSRHVLFRSLDAESIGAQMSIEPAAAATLVAGAVTQLKAKRDDRPAPYVDRTPYAGWTALVAAGHIAAARYLGRDDARTAGIAAVERIWRDAMVPGRGVVHRVGDASSAQLIEDQAYVMLAFIDAFEVTQDAVWLERAEAVAAAAAERFGDASGAFRDRPAGDEAVDTLTRPLLPVADAPTPSGNGAAALALFRLAALTGGNAHAARANRVLRALAGSAGRLLASAATFFRALTWSVLPVTTVVVIDDAEPVESSLLAAALRTYRPRTVVRLLNPAALGDSLLPPEIEAMVTGAAPRAYVCAGHVCAPPVASAAELMDTMRTFRPAG